MIISRIDLWFFLANICCRNISGSSLRGFLAPDLGQITYLQALYVFSLAPIELAPLLVSDVMKFDRILHGNHLIGIIPKEFGLLKYLKVLDLGVNQLSGPIPQELGNLTSVTTM